MRSTAKYPGLTRLIDAICCSAPGLPRISKREFQPLRGGVALLEIAARVTPGVSATLARNCSKYAPRAAHVVYEFSCSGMPDGNHVMRIVAQRRVHQS